MEISFDQGKTWERIDRKNLTKENKAGGKKVFSWTLWKYSLETSKIKGNEVDVMVRAIGSDGEVQ